MKLGAFVLLFFFFPLSSSWSSQSKIKQELIESIKVLLQANQELYPYQISEKSITTGLHSLMISDAYALKQSFSASTEVGHPPP